MTTPERVEYTHVMGIFSVLWILLFVLSRLFNQIRFRDGFSIFNQYLKLGRSQILAWNKTHTGLYYFNARWYDPKLGRFITEDPIRIGLNWFSYCGNNPVNRVDLNGLWDSSMGANANPYAAGGDVEKDLVARHRIEETGNALFEVPVIITTRDGTRFCEPIVGFSDEMINADFHTMINSEIFGEYLHKAIDIGVKDVDAFSTANREVVDVTLDETAPGGNSVTIKYPNGMTAIYEHMNVIYVKEGEHVVVGERIGITGNTGTNVIAIEGDGSHLHYQMTGVDGATYIDPMRFRGSF